MTFIFAQGAYISLPVQRFSPSTKKSRISAGRHRNIHVKGNIRLHSKTFLLRCGIGTVLQHLATTRLEEHLHLSIEEAHKSSTCNHLGMAVQESISLHGDAIARDASIPRSQTDHLVYLSVLVVHNNGRHHLATRETRIHEIARGQLQMMEQRAEVMLSDTYQMLCYAGVTQILATPLESTGKRRRWL